jgi:hypothetical protein
MIPVVVVKLCISMEKVGLTSNETHAAGSNHSPSPPKLVSDSAKKQDGN